MNDIPPKILYNEKFHPVRLHFAHLLFLQFNQLNVA
jgi:hypothetical protein